MMNTPSLKIVTTYIYTRTYIFVGNHNRKQTFYDDL